MGNNKVIVSFCYCPEFFTKEAPINLFVFLYNRLPKHPFRDYISKEKDTVASTASEYPLADFFLFSGPLPENVKMLVGIIPNPYERRSAAHGEPKAEYPDEILCHGGRKAPY